MATDYVYLVVSGGAVVGIYSTESKAKSAIAEKNKAQFPPSRPVVIHMREVDPG